MTQEVTITSVPDLLDHFNKVLTAYTAQVPEIEATGLRLQILIALATHTLVLHVQDPVAFAENLFFPKMLETVKAASQFVQLHEVGGLPN